MGYYWGDFYETVSTCDEYTEEQRKQFDIFHSLEKAVTLKDIRKVLRQYKLSEIEINRLNSPCLDGILVSAKYKKPLQKLIKSFPQYLETCKFYLEKNIAKRCLLMASSYGREKIVELLLDRGANIHAHANWALFNASKTGNAETVKLLLDRGMDIHTDYDKALCRAIPIDVVKLLIERGANIHAGDEVTLRWACVYGYTEIVKMVLDRGADIHIENDRPLMRASENGHIETLKLLLDRGANIHAGDEAALYVACRKNHYKVVELLLDRGATVNGSILQCIAFNDRPEITKLLSDRGLI